MSKIMKIYRRVKITRKTLFWSYFWLETLFRMRNSHFFKLDNRKKRKNAKFTHENGFSSQKYVSNVIFTLRLNFRIFWYSRKFYADQQIWVFMRFFTSLKFLTKKFISSWPDWLLSYGIQFYVQLKSTFKEKYIRFKIDMIRE